MVNTVPSSLLEESPYELGLNFGVYAPQMGTFFMRSHTVEKIPETGLGQGCDVVLGMTEKFNLTKGSRVAMEDLFTTLPLLDKLTDIGMYGMGTIRENRLQVAPLKNETALQKKTRGTFDYTSDGNNLRVAWRDGKVIIVVTNYFSLNPVLSTKSWSKAEKKHVDVPMPNPFKEYNANMGGVDLFDQFVSTSRVRIHSKKWWRPFFAWSINASVVIVWTLFRKIHGNNIPFYANLCLKP